MGLKYIPDLETIEGCENAVNHYIGRIKTVLDGTKNKTAKVTMWRFAVLGMAFIEGIIKWGPVPVFIIIPIFTEFIHGLNTRYFDWVKGGKNPKGEF